MSKLVQKPPPDRKDTFDKNRWALSKTKKKITDFIWNNFTIKIPCILYLKIFGLYTKAAKI